LISEHRGFVAYYHGDASEGVIFSISVFEDQADEEDFEPPGRGFRQGESRGADAEPTGDHGGPCEGSELTTRQHGSTAVIGRGVFASQGGGTVSRRRAPKN
jgi:hypothetical protein